MDMNVFVVLVIVGVAFAIGAVVGGLVVRKLDRSVRESREAIFNAELAAMKSQFEAVSTRLLKERSEEFKGENRENMERVTKPLLEELNHMREMLGRTKEEYCGIEWCYQDDGRTVSQVGAGCREPCRCA